MGAVRRGDFEAFERVYQTYYRRLYGFFYRLCWDRVYAEDLLQETFIRLWKGAKSFDPKRPLAPYLYRIGKNTWIDFERKRLGVAEQKRQASSGEKPTDSVSTTSDERPTGKPVRAKVALMGDNMDSATESSSSHPDVSAERKELEVAVQEALEELDADKRLVVVLSFYQGLRLREIAEILDLPLGTVKSRLFHAERNLRGLLKHLVS